MKIRNFLLATTCFFLLSLASIPAHSQGWDMTFGTPGLTEFIHSAKELPDSSIVFFGFTREWGNANFTFFLSKVDQHGELLWYHDYGAVFTSDDFLDFDTLSGGQFYLAGSEYFNTQRGHRTIIADGEGNIIQNNFSSFEEPFGNSSFVRGIKKDDNDEVWVIGLQLGGRYIFRKYGLQGELLWEGFNEELYNPNENAFRLDPVATEDDGVVFVVKVADEHENEHLHLVKIKEEEGVQWSLEFAYDNRLTVGTLAPTPDGGFLLTNQLSTILDTISDNQFYTERKDYLTKVDANGNLSWEYNLDTVFYATGQVGTPLVFPDGRIIITIQSGSRFKTLEFSSEGLLLNNILSFHAPFDASGYSPVSIAEPDTTRFFAFRSATDLLFYKTDQDQNRIWGTETHLWGRSTSEGLIQTMDGNLLSFGVFTPNGQQDGDALVIKLDSFGQINTHRLHGTVFFDIEENCDYDTSDLTLPDWIVQITGTPDKYAVTDTVGFYDATVDNDTLTVTADPISPYWQLCPDISPISFPDGVYSLTVDVPMQAITDCPYLVVDVSTALLRACKEGTYYVNYCNWGTIAEDSAWVEVIFDDVVQVDTASIPWDSQDGNIFTFSLGEVGVMECGQIEIDYSIPCDTTLIGQTLCAEARIFPDTICLSPEPFYSGALVEARVECGDSLVYFQLENVGTAATTGDLHYVVIEDAVLYMSEPFDLNEGEVLTIPAPANGATYHLFADQEPGAIGSTQISAGIEGCGLNEDDEISLGFLNQFPYNDYEPAMDIDCRNVVAAYDPNEKMAFPTGYGPEHLLAPNTPLDYLIRFQNTGNDTAFTVVLRDTLSRYLDPISVRPMNSSHPYTFDFATTEDGKTVLEFTFDPILLPDSTTNERESHGFVKFTVDQRQDLPIGTVIENRVGIYFDINAPVMTNTVWHTIGEDYIVVSLDDLIVGELTLITVAPNPVINTAIIQLEGHGNRNGQFQLFDMSGRLVRTQSFQNGMVAFDREGVVAGMYQFQVFDQAGQLMGQGKLVVQ